MTAGKGNTSIWGKMFKRIDVIIIVLFAIVPLFLSFPYRVNIFLSWEGAYRLSEGEMPYRDFGLPMGYMYWAVPAVFFKVFGAQMISLIKAQVFLNILSGLAFRSILKSLSVQWGIRILAVLLFCISFSFFNFWPWYNHTVIVYELVALALLHKYFFSVHKYRLAWLAGAGLFTAFSFMTKQDGGGMAFMLSCALLLYNCIAEKKWIGLPAYIGLFAFFLFLLIFPFTKYDFSYWFNYGQAPHTARVSAFEIIDDFFTSSQWIRFYLFLIVLLLWASFKNVAAIFKDRREMLFLLLTLGILGEAAILQVTSYTPPDNNIFYHSFAFVYILSLLSRKLEINFNLSKPMLVGFLGVMLWWSGVFWKYIQRFAERAIPKAGEMAVNGENVVNRKTYMISVDTTSIQEGDWTFSRFKSLNKIYMPRPTIEGMERILAMDIVKNKKDLQVLNMSELTSLAVEMPYRLEKGHGYPLWYHLGVAMFNKQAEDFERKIGNKQYDLILFEYIPTLNNFYPFRVRDSIQKHYTRVDSFYAPRRGKETAGNIEVYVR